MYMINEILLKLITLIHLLLVLFVALTPFIGTNYFRLLHFITVPFIMLHWICNDNTCVLTVVERFLRKKVYGEGKKDKVEEDCFTCKLIEPVYDFKKNYQAFSNSIYIITIGLWLITATRFYYQYKIGDIKEWPDLFRLTYS